VWVAGGCRRGPETPGPGRAQFGRPAPGSGSLLGVAVAPQAGSFPGSTFLTGPRSRELPFQSGPLPSVVGDGEWHDTTRHAWWREDKEQSGFACCYCHCHCQCHATTTTALPSLLPFCEPCLGRLCHSWAKASFSSEKFSDFGTVAISFVCSKYYSTMD